MRLDDASPNVLVVTDQSTKKRKSSRLVTDLRGVAEQWIWPVDLVTTAIRSKRFSASSRRGKVPTSSVVPLCETSMPLLQGVLARSIAAMKTVIMEEMREGPIPLLRVEDGAADRMATENVGANSSKMLALD